MAKLVSKVYGDALFELALEKNMLDEVWSETQVLADVWNEDNGFADMMANPRIAKEEKIAFINEVFGGRASEVITGFLAILVEKGRTAEIISVLDYYSDKVREYKKIGVAYVTSAIELSDSQKLDVEKKLLEVTDYVDFEIDYVVDASLIGGMVIRIGDRILDSSIKQKLNSMSRSLSRLQLS